MKSKRIPNVQKLPEVHVELVIRVVPNSPAALFGMNNTIYIYILYIYIYIEYNIYIIYVCIFVIY